MVNKKKKVIVLGATGMLGGAVYSVLKNKYSLVLTVKDLEEVKLLDKAYGGVEKHQTKNFDLDFIYQDYIDKKSFSRSYLNSFLNEVGDIDYVINAIGVTIPFSLKNPAVTFFINSAFPHIMANIFGYKFIHITTDCVYDGKKDYPYNEKSIKTPLDIYGLSKSLGEPQNCLTLRTSIFGRELSSFTGLLEWFLKQEGKTISGFTNHFWNGITAKEFGFVCDKIIFSPDKYPKTGLYHIFSDKVSKHDMLLSFKKKYNVSCEIKENSKPQTNRTLSTIYDFNSQLEIPSFAKMLEDL